MQTTIRFDEEKQLRKLDELRRKEQEDLAEILSHKYGHDYINLARVPINTDALRLVTEDTATTANVAVFGILGKRINVATLSPDSGASKEVMDELQKTRLQNYHIRCFRI